MEHVLQPWGAINEMQRPNSGRLQKKTFADASDSGRINGAIVYVRKGHIWKVIHITVCPTITVQYHSGNYLTAHRT
jgi:hypothetical protein